MHKIHQLIFTLTPWGGWLTAHLQKMETMMHSKLSKMTLSKNLGRDAIAKCSAQLLCEISTRASGAAAAISNFAFSHFFLFSSPCDLSPSTWCPPSPQVAWNGAILSFFALCHLFAHFQAVYLHRNAPPPQTDFEFVHHGKLLLCIRIRVTKYQVYEQQM